MRKGISILFLVACLTLSLTTAFADSGPTSAAVLPDGRQEVTIASLPGAECKLTSNATNSAGTSMLADDVGLVHLWALPALTSDRYSLDCKENGQSVKHDFDLADPDAFRPATARGKPTLRSALTGLANPLTVDASQLRAKGYPPRPDPKSSLYKKWLDIVSKPLVRIEPQVVEQPDVHFNPETPTTSPAWDGMAVFNQGRMSLAVGTFSVPGFTSAGNGSSAAIWSGLDGFGTQDLVQDGVFFQVTNNVGHCTAWFEYFPANPVFTNLVVSPYDSVDFWAWEGDASCNYGPNLTGFGCFWYENKTRGTTNGTFVVKTPAGAPAFSGATAEGVIERVGTSFLASWTTNSAFMAMDGYDWAWGYHDITNGPDLNISLVNGSGLNMATTGNVGGTNTMQFNWVRSH